MKKSDDKDVLNMKKILLAGAAAAATALVCGCGQRVTDSLPEQDGSRTDYSLAFFRNVVAGSAADDNVFVSPYSAGVALSMLAEGAEGETREEIVKALGGSTFAADVLEADSLVDVRSVNSAWVRSGFEVKKDYVSLLSKSYGAMIQTRNFSDPATVGAINRWCSDNTEGRIPEIIETISPDMVMFLINALYFKAPWETAFDESRTEDRAFHGSAGETLVPMMWAKEKYRYAEYQGCQLVELPYSGGRYSMLVALPASGMSMDDAVSYLSGAAYDAALGMLESREVILTMPKFKFETDMVLNHVFNVMGVERAFSNAAQFGGISDASVAVDEIRQKCFVEVNEQGSEAAAVTSISVRVTSAFPGKPAAVVMTVDRPFLFAIVDGAHDNILFMGRIMNINDND